MPEQTQILLVMSIYLVLLVLWGLYQARKVKTDAEYAIAGRNLPGWAAALSERAAGESSWALLGLPGFAYAAGLSGIWTAIGCVVGIITAWAALAWRLRDEAEKYRITTFTEYISKKHPHHESALRMLASAVIVFFFFFYVGAQFLGGGKTFHILFHLNPKLGMLITAIVIIPYTVLGGFRSVVYTDVIQAIIMITTLVLGPIVGAIYIANTPGLFAHSIGEALSKAGSNYTSLTGAAEGFAAGLVIVGGFSWFFGYLGGQPQLSLRFMAIRNPQQARRGRNIGILWTIVAYIGALSLGWLGIALFGPTGLNDPEYVMPSVMLIIFPPAIAGILITGALAAMLSTADSLLILSSTELSENLIKTAAKNKLLQCRIITACLALVALTLAYLSPSTLIYTIVGYVWAGVGGTFSIVILFTLFWKRFHGRAALTTIVAGMLFTVIWISTGLEAKITARVLTFVVAGIVAIIATFALARSSDR